MSSASTKPATFQDLAGQRIGKVITTLMKMEELVAGMIARCGLLATDHASSGASDHEKRFVNGPRLDGESGHATQQTSA